MKIVSYNINGIRAGINKGLIDWLVSFNPDIVCFQEVKGNQEDVNLKLFEDIGYKNIYWFSAQKKGYSGVAILSKTPMNQVIKGSGFAQSDFEGRVIQAIFGDYHLINAYFPSGTSGDDRQLYKYQWLDEMNNYLQSLLSENKKVILVGDYNIAHKAIDLKNAKANEKNSGFLPEERQWLDKLFTSGFHDTFRMIHGNVEDKYSWWTYRAGAREKNVGWRIDYISVSNNITGYIENAGIEPDAKHSDHCPIWIKLKD